MRCQRPTVGTDSHFLWYGVSSLRATPHTKLTAGSPSVLVALRLIYETQNLRNGVSDVRHAHRRRVDGDEEN